MHILDKMIILDSEPVHLESDSWTNRKVFCKRSFLIRCIPTAKYYEVHTCPQLPNCHQLSANIGWKLTFSRKKEKACFLTPLPRGMGDNFFYSSMPPHWNLCEQNLFIYLYLCIRKVYMHVS